MTGTASQIPDKDFPRQERIRKWVGVLIIITSYLGVFAAGATSGYFVFRAESLQRTEQRDKAISEIQQKVEQLPQQLKAEEEKK